MEFFKYGSVGRALRKQCLYPELFDRNDSVLLQVPERSHFYFRFWQGQTNRYHVKASYFPLDCRIKRFHHKELKIDELYCLDQPNRPLRTRMWGGVGGALRDGCGPYSAPVINCCCQAALTRFRLFRSTLCFVCHRSYCN